MKTNFTKKLYSMVQVAIISATLLFSENVFSASCCPKFNMNLPDVCSDSTECKSTAGGRVMKACKNSKSNYTVYPFVVGYTYTWTVVGGTPSSTTGNSIDIVWGTGNNGYFKVVITENAGPCKDSIEGTFCLVNGPKANFTHDAPKCAGQAVNFTNTSIGGTSYSWNFGDGSTSNAANPSHAYASTGMYIVTLTVSNNPSNPSKPQDQCTYCQDTKIDTIYILSGTGPVIERVGCGGTLCASASPLITQYSTTSTCSPLVWSIPAGTGTITAGQGTNLVTIQWNTTFTVQPTVTLCVPVSCSGSCAPCATVTVPIIYPNLPINGPNPVCVNSNNVYNMMHLPGCYYTTTFSATNNASLNPITPIYNSSSASIHAGTFAGNYTIKFNYYDSLKHCGGQAVKNVTVKDKFKITALATKVCEGSTENYFANGNAQWQVDSAGVILGAPYIIPNGNTATITWPNPGVYTLIAKPINFALFCDTIDRVTIEVIAKPKLTTTQALSFNICPNELMTIHVNTTNMDFPFTWNITGGTILANDDTTVTVSWGATGGTISVFQTNPNLICPSNTIVFTANPYAAPSITPTSPACEDDVVVYTATPAGMPSYNWTVVNGSIVSQSGNQVTIMWAGNTSGGHSIKVSTCSGSATQNIAVASATPTSVFITSLTCSSAVCSSSVAGAGPYSWYLNGAIQGGFTTQTINVTTSGFWSCKPTGCYKRSGIQVNIPAPPILTISTPIKTFCIASTGAIPAISFYSALSTGYVINSYQWFGPAVNNGPSVSIGGATNPIYNAASPFIGNYYLVVTYGGGCTVTSGIIHIDTGCASAPCALTPFPSTFTFTESCGPGGAMNFTTNFTPPAPGGTTLSWDFGDGTSGTSATAGTSHVYTLPGVYQVCATTVNSNYCSATYCKTIRVEVVPNFSVAKTCTGATLVNTSQLLAPAGTPSISWSTVGGSVAPLVGNTTTLTGSGVVTMTVIYLGCTTSITKTITIPSSTVAISQVHTACRNEYLNNLFTTVLPTNNYLSFNWHFGDGTTSNLCPTSHAYNNSSSPYTTYSDTLFVVDTMGCVAMGIDTVHVDTLPIVKLITSDSFICKGSYAILKATSGLTNYKWYRGTTLIATTSTDTIHVYEMGMYTVEATDGHGCKSKSNVMPIVVRPLPKIKITFPNGTIACVNGLIGGSISANTIYNINYGYAWSVDAPLTVSPNNFNFTNINVPAGTTAGTYSLYLLVYDSTTKCSKMDTVCIFVRNKPNVTIAPPGPLCEGVVIALTPTPNNPVAYTYNWSNGATTPIDSVSIAGFYSLTITDKQSGCSANSNFVQIKALPDVSLFPQGCDTLCDTAHLYIPLPNNINLTAPNSNYPVIQWYVDGTPNVIGNFLYLNTLTLGSHTIKVTVTGANGCTNTTGNYTIFVKQCVSCFDSCCNEFLDEMNHGDISVNYVNSTTASFTLPTLLSTDIVRWDYNCDGIVDSVTYGNSAVMHNYSTAGNYVVCVRIERILFGDTCWAKLTKKVVIDKNQTPPCSCDATFASNVNQGFATSATGYSMTFVPIALTNCDTVTWNFGDGSPSVISVGNTPVVHAYTNSQVYMVCMMVIRAGSPNCRREFCKNINVTNAIGDYVSSNIKIYPSPVRDYLNIEMNDLTNIEQAHIKLTDITGRVYIDRCCTHSQSMQKLDMRELSNGVYLLSVVQKDGKILYNQRVMKF